MQITLIQKRAIDNYYKELDVYKSHKVTHETAIRSAFQNLLQVFAQSANWVLIPEQSLPNGKRPDGTLRDSFNLPRGYWEAKDTKDDLHMEIRKKIFVGYPILNTIFEDTRHAVLYQNNRLVLEVNLDNSKELIQLLDTFFHYAAPDIANFERAVKDFKESIPDLARGLMERIEIEHAKNKNFTTAFAGFFEQCRESLDPNMNRESVNEMLVQHLLTERLFRTIFNNSDFTRRNVIAAEIENVIETLTSRAFNRNEFLKSLDRFYVAIEDAARNIDDWMEKQTFLNTVYERFFQGFSIKQADTHGIVYTPQEIVDFMVASVDSILQKEFNSSISMPGIQILDPSTGTGNFIVNLVRNISGSALEYKYEHDLFCNEIMLLPYYIASLNIEHSYYERTGQYKPFDGVCFADTLNLTNGHQLPLFAEKNTKRVEQEKLAQIMVVIGNPPYNVGQKNENDDNKNRKYKIVDERIRETYVKNSKATNTRAVSDAYVKFFRWATDRLEERDGVVCLISNNGFLSGVAFDGFRKCLAEEFTHIYVLDLGGNARKQEGGNVFGIMVGVSITILVRARKKSPHQTATILYHKVQDNLKAGQKLLFLKEKGDVSKIEWQELHPDSRHTWLTTSIQPEFDTFLPMGTKEAKVARAFEAGGAGESTIFKIYSRGAETTRDNWMYDFDRSKLVGKVRKMIDMYNSEVLRWIQAGCPQDIDRFVINDDTKIKWSSRLKEHLRRQTMAVFQETNIRNALYRPFTHRYLYFDSIMTHRQGMLPLIFPTPFTETENIAIWLKVGSEWPMFALATNVIPDLLPQGGSQCFPYYVYAQDGTNRRENITNWALQQFQDRYGLAVTKRDIFHYIYAMLHHPSYRQRFAENMKRDLPRIPLLKEQTTFEACVHVGKQLMDLHINYRSFPEYQLTWIENKNVPITWSVEKMKIVATRDAIHVNDWLRLENIPQECFQYRLGSRSALEWVVDQYQVSADIRSGISSDPNREDEPEYIVRLIGRVVAVSVKTVHLVSALEEAVDLENEITNTIEGSVNSEV